MEEAKAIMKQRAKELNQIKKDAQRSGKTKGFAGKVVCHVSLFTVLEIRNKIWPDIKV